MKRVQALSLLEGKGEAIGAGVGGFRLDGAAEEPLFVAAPRMAANQQLRILHRHPAVGRNRVRQPDIAADDAVVPDARVAAKNRGTWINGNALFDVGVALVCRT